MPRVASLMPYRYKAYAWAASLGLHVLLILMVLWSTPGPLPIPPLVPLKLLDLSLPKANTLLDGEPDAPPCGVGKSYRGIGMQFNLRDIVINAPQSYPAFQAGIRVGDIVIDPNIEPDGEGYETVNFIHSGKAHRLRIKTEWICLR